MVTKYNGLKRLDCVSDFRDGMVSCKLLKGTKAHFSDPTVELLAHVSVAGDNLKIEQDSGNTVYRKMKGKLNCVLENDDSELVCK